MLRSLWSKLRTGLLNADQAIPFLSSRPDLRRHRIGRGSYGWPEVLALGKQSLEIGNYCSIARDVLVLLHAEHHPEWITTYPFPVVRGIATAESYAASKGPVRIGHDVWIGQRAILLSNIRIGNGAVVAAGSVVTKDVPSFAIVAGNPARVIRYRFSPGQIEALERIAWWNWDETKIQGAMSHLLSPDVAHFIDRFDPGTGK